MRSLNALQLPSKRLILSYIFDWIVIIAIAGVSAGWANATPYHRPFSLVDLDISFPHDNSETISTWLLVVCGLVAPGIIIFLVCLIFVPGRAASRNTPTSLIWRRKFWEWNTGWMGLGMSLATAFLITQGMKNLFGRPRPDLLSRCQPDASRIGEFTVGRYAQDVGPTWVLVSSGICTQTDKSVLDDGFRSFPSGHASFAWAGLLYLTLFLCSKFAIATPFLPPRPYSQDPSYTILERRNSLSFPSLRARGSAGPKVGGDAELGLQSTSLVVPIRNQAAAPPTYTLVLALIPIGAAVYITASRFFDFRHHGLDITFGALIGIVCAYFSFRWYHLPIRQGAGWAWGARSRDRAWGIGVGIQSYVGPEGWASAKDAKTRDGDLEAGYEDQTSTLGPRTAVAREEPVAN